MFDRPFRSAQIGASAVAAAALSIFLIAAAFAKAPSTLTFHFFSKVETFSITNAAGNPLSANAARRPGDVIQATDLNYVGNHRHHAAHWTSTDHLRCVISAVTSMGFQAVCDGQVAIGGSMLLADHVVSTFTRNAKSVPLNRGTGVYLGYHGLAISRSIGHTNNTDFTITVHRASAALKPQPPSFTG